MKIEEVKDLDFLIAEVKHLWAILDDIDTCSDMAKDNDAWYRKRVEGLQAARWDNITSDGYNLYRKI